VAELADCNADEHERAVAASGCEDEVFVMQARSSLSNEGYAEPASSAPLPVELIQKWSSPYGHAEGDAIELLSGILGFCIFGALLGREDSTPRMAESKSLESR
jgi:predicted RecB family nuclease